MSSAATLDLARPPSPGPGTDLAACAHCGAAVPAARGGSFCCDGCATVHAVLAAAGLDEGWARVGQTCGLPGAPARPSSRAYAELDDPAFAELHVRPAGPDGALRAAELYLEQAHCAACVWLLERLPRVQPGVVDARLELGRGRCRVTWDPAVASLSQVARAIDGLGYPVHPWRGLEDTSVRRREERDGLVQIAVAGALAGNVMLLAFALYGGDFAAMAHEHAALLRWTCMLLTIPAVLGPGRTFLRGAWAALRTRTPHMDLPVALGIVAGTAHGVVNTLRGAGDVYFDTVVVLILLLRIARWLERRATRRAADAAAMLTSLTPSSARRLEPGAAEPREVPIESLRPGDLVVVRPGEALPVDGTVEAGRSRLDLSLLTGESRPVAVGPGDVVHAGTLDLEAPLTIRTAHTGERTRVGRLLRLVDDAAGRKAPIVALADRVAGGFVVAVLLLAGVVLLRWWPVEPSRAIDSAVALLIGICPCVLGLATPLAINAALGRAARHGVIVKGGDVLERLTRPGRVWLDKTGTVTEGRTRLVTWDVAPGMAPLPSPASVAAPLGADAWVLPDGGPREAEVRALTVALEAGASHPIARALVDALGAGDALEAVTPTTRGAAGVEATFRLAGRARRVAAGAPAWILERLAGPQDGAARAALAWLDATVPVLLERALTPVAIAVDGRVVALAGLGDRIRDDARAAVDRLRARGWEVGLLSGDHPAVVQAVGRALGLEPARCLGGVSPEQKVEVVRASHQGAPTVVMVGDGVNDAAALAAASVGIGVQGGAEAALGAADVFVTRPGLGPVADLVDAARAARTTIARGLAISLAYNIVAATLAVQGLITPWFAALLMPFSSLSVIWSASRPERSDPWR